MTNQHTVSDAVLRLAIIGEVDVNTAAILIDTTTKLITAGHITELIIDLDAVTFLDAAGISSLVRGHNVAAACDVAHRVTNAHDRVYKVLDITGVLRLLTEPPQPSRLPRRPATIPSSTGRGPPSFQTHQTLD